MPDSGDTSGDRAKRKPFVEVVEQMYLEEQLPLQTDKAFPALERMESDSMKSAVNSQG